MAGGSRIMSNGSETPFDNIESAEQFLKLLIEAIEESRRDVDTDISLAEGNLSELNKKTLELVSTNLAKLIQHMTASRRILRHLRTLRQFLVKEQLINKKIQKRSSNLELSPWT